MYNTTSEKAKRRRNLPICSKSVVLSSAGPPSQAKQAPLRVETGKPLKGRAPISRAGMQSTGKLLAISSAPFPVKSQESLNSFILG